MYLANKDLQYAIETGRLIFDPPPSNIDDTDSIDVTLGDLEAARIINEKEFAKNWESRGRLVVSGDPFPILYLGQFRWSEWQDEYLCPPPTWHKELDPTEKVFILNGNIVLKPNGYLIWSTKEIIGTPKKNPEFVVYIDGKSSRARTGLVVHLTAPHIHAGWSGPVTLEIANLGGLNLAISPGDTVAQIRAARLTDIPLPRRSEREIDSSELPTTESQK